MNTGCTATQVTMNMDEDKDGITSLRAVNAVGEGRRKGICVGKMVIQGTPVREIILNTI